VILQLGSIEPVEVGKMLQKERRGVSGISHTFALELAYIMEHFGDNNISDAKLILELYLHGAKSLLLAVSYAQRNTVYTDLLWELLVGHCLTTNGTKTTSDDSAEGESHDFNGSTFGSLLESAALCGADLAKLVAQIPAGMQVEGLKPRLVAAVTDYRLKVQMHENASAIAKKEKLTLLQELTQRARKGMRYEVHEELPRNGRTNTSSSKVERVSRNKRDSNSIISPSLRTVIRRDRFALNYSLPIR
jgi:vacuolar protein sorting-associated protein 41